MQRLNESAEKLKEDENRIREVEKKIEVVEMTEDDFQSVIVRRARFLGLRKRRK